MDRAATHFEHRQARQRRGAPLWWFASLSLLLHAGLLWHWRQAPITIAAPASAGMAVRLVEQQQAKAAAPVPPRQQSAAISSRPTESPRPKSDAASTTAETAPRPAKNLLAEQDTAPPSGKMAAAEEQAGKPNAGDDTALEAGLKVILQQELARHFSYPLLARRRGWQGEVLLAFRLETDGRIMDARVVRSSGYGMLDRAALAALGKVGRIASGVRRGLAMQLPVIYRLEG